jgi:serpin B
VKHLLAVLWFVLLPLADLAADEPAVVSGDRAAAVAGNSEFAADLYARLAEQKGNLFLSPASISTALAMTYAGARGETASEMAQTLHFTLDQHRLHPAIAGLLNDLDAGGATNGYQLDVANALWVQQGFTLLGDFTALVKANYGAGLNEVDFRNAIESSRQTINSWVEGHTARKITNLIPEGLLASDTRLVLTNAVYFKDRWLSAFHKNLTRDEDFHLADGQQARVPMMQLSGEFNCARENGFQILALPYQDKHLSMILFLPDKPDGLVAFEKSMSAAHIKGWLEKLRNTSDVHVSLPRFKLTEKFSLGDTLAAIGMRQAFDRHDADFSGMTGKRTLFISDSSIRLMWT